MATHSSILAWEILWTQELGRLQSMGSQIVGHNLATKQYVNICLLNIQKEVYKAKCESVPSHSQSKSPPQSQSSSALLDLFLYIYTHTHTHTPFLTIQTGIGSRQYIQFCLNPFNNCISHSIDMTISLATGLIDRQLDCFLSFLA